MLSIGSAQPGPMGLGLARPGPFGVVNLSARADLYSIRAKNHILGTNLTTSRDFGVLNQNLRSVCNLTRCPG